MTKHGNNNEKPSQISSIDIGVPWFCMEEIYVQIIEFVDRETNVRRKCSMVLRGSKILSSSFWTYFHRYRDKCFVDRATKSRK